MTLAFCTFWMAAHRRRAQAELNGLVVLRAQKSEVKEARTAGFVGQLTKVGSTQRKSARKLHRGPFESVAVY